MADVSLRVNGDASGGVDATNQAGRAVEDLGRASADASKKSAEEVGKATVKWAAYTEAAKAALKAVVDFGVQSVKAYAESERVSRQLERAAGDLADVFEAQAEALSRTLAVDDDLIKQQQTLLLQWGAAPSQVEGATRAVLDYAAATGKDALTATTELIKGVETGGEKFKALGIQYVATGDKTKDLAALTEALAKKFGGAAQADADSLVGSARAAELAFDDMSKAFGAFIADAGQKTGVVAALTEAMRGLQTAMGGNSEFNAHELRGKQFDEYNMLIGSLSAGEWGGDKNGGTVSRAQAEARAAELKALLFSAPKALPTQATGGTKLGDEKKAAGAKADETYWTPGDAARLGGEVDEQGGPESAFARMEEAEKASQDRRIDQAQRAYEALLKEQNEFGMESLKTEKELARKSDDLRLSAEEKRRDDYKAHLAEIEKETERSAARVREQDRIWANAGDQIGGALVRALAKQIDKLNDGGEIDVKEMMMDMTVAIIGIAAIAVGTYFGAPQVGGAVGELLGMGFRYGVKAYENEQGNQKHDGGWSGVERYHSGGWLGRDEEPAILQHGERVLSRTEVSRMGGQAAVDSVAKGGARGVTINVSALDAKSASEAFEDQTGRGFWRAIRSGHGDVARLFGEVAT